jgi:hypothetical protein
MQGVQIFAGLDDAWGGFAGEYVERLRDEYGKNCIWVWGSRSPDVGVQREKRRMRMANTAQSLNKLSTSASMVIPMALPNTRLPYGIKLDISSSWHLSALLSSALESATLPLRLTSLSGQQQPLSMDQMTEFLNTSGNQTLARLKMSAGQRLEQTGDEKNGDEDDNALDLFNLGEGTRQRKKSRKFGQVNFDRGLGEAKEIEDEHEDDRTRSNRPLPGNPVIRK